MRVDPEDDEILQTLVAHKQLNTGKVAVTQNPFILVLAFLLACPT